MKVLKIFFSLMLFLTVGFASNTAFELKDIQGNTYHVNATSDSIVIDELKGQVVFIAFFGHRCPPCRMEIPGFISYTNNKDYAKKSTILAFEVQGLQRGDVKSFAKDAGINYRLVPGSESSKFIDYVGAVTSWNYAIPFMVVLDKDGKIKTYGNGIVSPEELMSMTDQILQPVTTDNKTTQQGGKHE